MAPENLLSETSVGGEQKIYVLTLGLAQEFTDYYAQLLILKLICQ